MAKIFTTSGTGASQTLNEADSNKISVYDSYEDINTADLVDGEIVSTKETSADGSNVYDYINEMLTKENLLSEWEDITIPTTAADAITMDYDGKLYISVGLLQGVNRCIYINGVSFDLGILFGLSNAEVITSNFIPFKKGDVIYVSAALYGSKVACYKQRYYGGRQ